MNRIERRVVVNADDLGLSEGVNLGIIHAHEHGILTSASLMVRQSALDHAATYCRTHPKLGVGLHLDLGEWRLIAGEWVAAYEVVPLQDAAAVEQEVVRQLTRFEQALGRKPTHLDSHQHVHRREPVKTILQRFAFELNVPLRGCGALHSCGDFYGQLEDGVSANWMVSSENLVRILCALPSGNSEVSCHPGFADDLESDYRIERRLEVNALCDPQVRAAVEREKLQLVTFDDLA